MQTFETSDTLERHGCIFLAASVGSVMDAVCVQNQPKMPAVMLQEGIVDLVMRQTGHVTRYYTDGGTTLLLNMFESLRQSSVSTWKVLPPYCIIYVCCTIVLRERGREEMV